MACNEPRFHGSLNPSRQHNHCHSPFSRSRARAPINPRENSQARVQPFREPPPRSSRTGYRRTSVCFPSLFSTLNRRRFFSHRQNNRRSTPVFHALFIENEHPGRIYRCKYDVMEITRCWQETVGESCLFVSGRPGRVHPTVVQWISRRRI